MIPTAYVVIGLPSIITVIGVIYAARTSSRQTIFAAQLEARTDTIKSEALSKAEVVKAETAAETQRIDQIVQANQKFIDTILTENDNQRKEMQQLRDNLDTMRTKMESCLDERQDLKLEVKKLSSLYGALSAQMKNTKEYQKLEAEDKVVIDRHENPNN